MALTSGLTDFHQVMVGISNHSNGCTADNGNHSHFAEITKTTPEKSLLVSLQKQSGRNNQGKITVRHRGGGPRRKYRVIDFKRNKKDGIPATVVGIEYDPNRTANIALICYADGEKTYIIAPEGLKDGMKVMNGPGKVYMGYMS